MRLSLPTRKSDHRRSRGQSLVELALVLPVILFVTMVALDLGRVYLGYVNLQNMARIAANFAANNPTAWASGDTATQTKYRNQIVNDAAASNCHLPQSGGDPVVPTPAFADAGGNGSATDVGDAVTVEITCTFRIATPFVSNVIGTNGDLAVSAKALFPVKAGMLGTSGGGPVTPTAEFNASPVSGAAPLPVQFTDQSTGNPTSWTWDFDGDGTIDSVLQDPVWTYTSVGTYTVTLAVANGAGQSAPRIRTGYITVTAPTSVVTFTATPTSGDRPLTVQFTDQSTNAPTSWAWDFDNNGSIDSTSQDPTFTYNTAGVYSVTLTVTNAGGPASTTVTDMISVGVGTCTVPNFAGLSTDVAQATWSGAGFTTTVNYQQGNRPWIIASQSQVVGQSLPCNSTITVSKN